MNYGFKLDKKKNKINNGIQILRMILSYIILQFHCYNIHQTKNKILIFSFKAIFFYVPIFFIISYYFSYKIINSKNITQINLRFQRILIPYIIIPIIFFLFHIIAYHLFKDHKISYKDLFIQLLTGKRINDVFWFQCNLILTFIFVTIIRILIKSSNFLFITQIIGIIGSIYHAFDLKYHFFNMYMIETRTLFHDFPKLLFYTSIGMTLASIFDINVKVHRKKIIFFAIYNLYIIKDFIILINEPYFYLRCFIVGLGSTSIFLIFSMIPLDDIENRTFNLIIKQITSYTGGIYYFHYKFKDILKDKLNIIKNQTLFGCFVNYILCYIFCFFGIKVFGKTKLKYLFS